MAQRSIPAIQHLPANLFNDEAVAYQYLLDMDVLKVPVTCSAGHQNRMSRNVHKGICYYQCTKKDCRRGCMATKGSFFQHAKIGLHKVLHLAYLWITRSCNETMIHQTGLSNTTVVDWALYLREVVMLDLMSLPEDEVQLGGWVGNHHIIVQVDEMKLGKRKYNQGHRVEGVWIVGLVELTEQRRFVLLPVPNRSRATLTPIIEKYVAPGSYVYTDEWGGYNRGDMMNMGIVHETVKHAEHFKDPYSGVHTNVIEGNWGPVRTSVPKRCRTTKLVETYLAAFAWRRRFRDHLWARLLYAMAHVQYGDAVPPAENNDPVVEEFQEYAWENACTIC